MFFLGLRALSCASLLQLRRINPVVLVISLCFFVIINADCCHAHCHLYLAVNYPVCLLTSGN